MKFLSPCLAFIFLLVFPAGLAAAEIKAPARLAAGQPALVRISAPPAGRELRIIFQERVFPVHALPHGGYAAIIAAGLNSGKGEYELRLLDRQSVLGREMVKVTDKDYGTRNIRVEEKYVEPGAALMERIERENSQQLEVFQAFSVQRCWHGPFIRPLSSAVVGKFGRRSIINGQPRAPHGGVDLRGAAGTPVKAVAAGRVALVMDSYFSGKLALIDHGQGLVSAYRHLSKITVTEGQVLQQGQTLGLVGATGRVTGPHLHFDMRLSGAVVDPLALIDLTKTLSELLREK